jgi:branched-chain amino acid transport system ATP-binding protein
MGEDPTPAWIMFILNFPYSKERKNQNAGTLSGGERQMLAIGCALMAKPQLMVLDEPTGGLAPLVVTSLFNVVRDIHQEGTSLLMVEQNAKKAIEVGERNYLLQGGKIKLQGKTKDLLQNEEVAKHYLGV